MVIASFIKNPYFTVAAIALLLNIPFGYIRQQAPKFSFKWLLWIHASIPILIYLRLKLDVHAIFIPVTIFMAVVGQIIGGRLALGQMTDDDHEKLQQIPDLNIRGRATVKDKDVMVALLNMGGPRTNDDVKDFQQRLFADPLLIRFPLSFLLQKLFAWLLITFRLKAVKERYQEIGGGSPIYQSTTRQAKALREELHRRGRDVDVTFSFNYSPPLPEDTVKELKDKEKKHLIPISLYPHYSKATTGSNIHYLKKAAHKFHPELKLLTPPSYHLHEGYITAFVERILQQIKPGESLNQFYLVFTAHGLPLYFLTEGDPYPFLIHQTVSQVLAKLERTKNWIVCYQSAVGPLQWLKPATDDVLPALRRKGVKKVIMVPIAFVGDHIETLHEIDIEYRELAEKLGFEDYRMSKAIETHPGFIRALADTVEASLPEQMPLFNHKPPSSEFAGESIHQQDNEGGTL